MKSQFSKIAKIRKQKRDAIERELMKSQNKERLLTHKIASLYDDIAAVQMPKEGLVTLLLMVNEQKSILNREKKRYEQELFVVERNTKRLQGEYQKAHVEYEKIKYLEEQELQAMMDKLKREEQLYLDEISTMLFAGEISQKR
ncbi:MAG: flagellar export protein FliJ [Sulfurospirillum sp.]|jgi:CII-binding regulator of phage lambda lysogenization HflD|uniref:flagellar export protein FliJ n=1 Tax=Sulfurospirillum sp. UCH001 TaxID=1581011 RepID=UPI00083313EA|nr:MULTISPECIES: flagellar export protein FliJ [unclassified Sulfurospirillum]WNY99672.1 flagellar export protein FliJ [Sulfurospirillum sp. 'SP']